MLAQWILVQFDLSFDCLQTLRTFQDMLLSSAELCTVQIVVFLFRNLVSDVTAPLVLPPTHSFVLYYGVFLQQN